MIFITFEGPEGSGKSTQIKVLQAYLIKSGFSVVKTREPGGSVIAEKIRRILLDPKSRAMAPETELLLYLASRAQHVKDKIRPALKEGKIVICDRFFDSTLAYQGYARGFSGKLLTSFNNFATGGLKPDLTLYFDLDIKLGLKRAQKRTGKKDRLEAENKAFHEKVRKGYLTIAKMEPGRVKLINALSSIEEIAGKVAMYVDRKLKNAEKHNRPR